MANQHCTTTGKIIYEKKDADVAVVKANNRRAGDHGVLQQRTYQCEHCRKWHMTSRPRGEKGKFDTRPKPHKVRR